MLIFISIKTEQNLRAQSNRIIDNMTTYPTAEIWNNKIKGLLKRFFLYNT